MPDVQILAPGQHASPLDYVVPGAQEILIKAIAASYDGTSAAGSFVPCLQLIAPGGVLAATCPLGSTVAAGSSADVSWFPRGGAVAAGNAGSGIQFDTYPQTGDWLEINTTGESPSSGASVNINGAPSGIILDSNDPTASGLSFVRASVEGTNNSGLALEVAGAGNSGIRELVSDDNNNGINVQVLGANNSGWGVTVDGTNNLGAALDVVGGNTGINLTNDGSGPVKLRQVGAGGIRLWDANGGINATTTGTGQFQSSGAMSIESTGSTAQLLASGDASVHSTGGAANLEGFGGGATIFGNTVVFVLSNAGSGSAGIQNRLLQHGATFEVMDNTPITQLRVTPQGSTVLQVLDKTGASIFEVRDTGALHGKTGQALTFDL